MSQRRRPAPDAVLSILRKARPREARNRLPGMGAPTARATQRSTPLTEVSLPAAHRIGLEPGVRAFRFGECFVLLGRSAAHGWHLSISHPRRYPTWDEIAGARYRLVPDEAVMAMILPRQAEYVNYHENCFHLHEIERESSPRE